MEPPKITYRDPVELRLHPLQKALPEPDKASPEWHAFVDGLAAAGPEAIPPLICTREGLVMDGGRRWRAAKQLQWTQVPCIERPEHEAGALIVETLLGQRNLSLGAKVLRVLEVEGAYRSSVNARIVARGGKTSQKPLKLAKAGAGNSVSNEAVNSVDSESLREMASRLGCSYEIVRQARRVLAAFQITHEFEFQDGSVKTLAAHFRPKIDDSSAPMGLGEALKGIGWFVDENGRPKKQLPPPPDRNSVLHYLSSGFTKLGKQFVKLAKMPANQREAAREVVEQSVSQWPDEMLETISEAAKREARKRRGA